MKVLLIKPHTHHPSSLVSEAESILPPMGLLYIASNLEKNEHDVAIFDYDIEKRKLADCLQGVDIVGITAFSPQFPEAIRIAKEIKSFDKNIKTVLGGCHATAMGEYIMQEYGAFDYVVKGEGEITMNEIVLGNVTAPGICRKDSTTAPSFVSDLNSLPFPARHLIDLKKYRDSPLYYRRGPHTTFLASRGCVFQCIYCDYATRGSFRLRSPENVISELKLLKEGGFRDLRMLDECFTLNRKNTERICELMIQENLDFSWNCQTRADTLTDDTLGLMRKAGCFNIQIGVETGSERIMKMINKRLDFNVVKRAVKMVKDHGMTIYGFFMLGFPSETKEEMRQTIEFAKSTDFDTVTFSIVTPYPATKLWEDAGLKPDLDLLESLVFYSPKKPFFKVEDAEGIFNEAVRGFYTRPKIVLKLLNEGLTKGSLERRWRYMKFLTTGNPLFKGSKKQGSQDKK